MLQYSNKRPLLTDFINFLFETKDYFDIPLDQKVNIINYAYKLYNNASFIVCKDDETIVGVICCYMNRPPSGYISHVCVSNKFQGQGIFSEMFKLLEEQAKLSNIKEIQLEVGNQNNKAQKVYKNKGFILYKNLGDSFLMKKTINPN